MGRVVIELSHSRTLSAEEQRFADWVTDAAEDLIAVFATIFPDDAPAIDVQSLCVEERLPDGRIAVHCLDIIPTFPESWEHCEEITRAGLERVKEENPCA